MNPDEAASSHDTPGDATVAETYELLNLRRVDLDRHIAALATDDPARDEAWQELEATLAEMRRLVGLLACSPANCPSELRAKAEVLVTLLRPGEPGGGPVIPKAEQSALALSLADDVIGLPNG